MANTHGVQVSLLLQLQRHHLAIEEGIDEIRSLCEQPAPSLANLAAARVQLSRRSNDRSAFVRGIVLPALLRSPDAALADELAGLQASMNAKRLASSHHVARWSSSAIEKDWAGYVDSSRRIRLMMEKQIERERAVLCYRLRKLQL